MNGKTVAGLFSGLLYALTLCGIGSVAGCASQQLKFDSLNKRDKLRYAACRKKVARNLCPDDPDCEIKAAELYAKEPAHARLQWLRDYGCPREYLVHVDEKVRADERKSIGLPPQ